MTGSTKYLNAYRAELMKRAEIVKRQAYLTSLEFTPVQDLTFKVIAQWGSGEFAKEYTYSDVFRYSGTRTPVPKTSVCAARRKLTQEIMRARGI